MILNDVFSPSFKCKFNLLKTLFGFRILQQVINIQLMTGVFYLKKKRKIRYVCSCFKSTSIYEIIHNLYRHDFPACD